MRFWLSVDAGLALPLETPPYASAVPVDAVTEEAAIVSPHGTQLRVEMIASEGEVVAEGAPVARLRHSPDIQLVAPMPSRVARINLLPGQILSEVVLFREAGADFMQHKWPIGDVASPEGLRRLLQRSGYWPRLRRRPFGVMPLSSERPAAILVMACDSRPHAPDPSHGLKGREEALDRGLMALSILTDGPVYVCYDKAGAILGHRDLGDRIHAVGVSTRNPQGLPGMRIHDLCPATQECLIWDIQAEDVADLGSLLETGILPQTRIVSVVGNALMESRLLRCQIGANTRGLIYGAVRPGAHIVMTNSPLDGRPAHWLGPRDRQVTVVPEAPKEGTPHWFVTALTRSSLPKPLIPTAALMQATGGAFPAMAMLRALSAGDDETAAKLGALSLLEEDLGLVDYIVGGAPRVSDLLRAFLDRAEAETAL